MATLAKRLDPCRTWFKLLAGTNGRILWIFPIVLVGAYFGAVATDSHPIDEFLAARSLYHANSPLLAEARRLNLGYEQVLAEPKAYVGKPVTWCINGETDSTGFVDTRATRAISWTPPSDDFKQGRGAYGYCWNVLAVVEGAERGMVKLRIVERL